MTDRGFEVGVITLFPELFRQFLSETFVGRARAAGQLKVELEHLRNHGLGKHKSVDDTPYGGGSGMVLRVDCVVAALEAVGARMSAASSRKILLSPQGNPFRQATAERWAAEGSVVFVCGRYEGFDERIRDYVDEEASLGDFVMMGGEIAAMAMMESCLRLIPGVLGNSESMREESFSSSQQGGLEYPQFTRPAEFRGMPVPGPLTSGNHEAIRRWRADESKRRTRARRPDLLPSETVEEDA